jgi:CubicO group peptidase (beta-lactamase class C family)
MTTETQVPKAGEAMTGRLSKLVYRLLNVTGVLLTFGIVGAGVLYSLAAHPPAPPLAVATVDELDAYLTKLTASGDPPGLSVIVVKGDKVIYSRAFGLADGPAQIAATPDTVYHWWSMTKIVTAIAVLQLSERGRLNLDAPVAGYLPWFDVQYGAGASNAVAVRHLLNHSSGLPDPMPAMIGWMHYADKLVDQTDLLRHQLPQFSKLQSNPGTKAAYTNLGYMVLGAIVERVSGQSYAAYVTDNILHPLGMQHTGFLYPDERLTQEARGSQQLVHLYTPLLPFLLDTKALIHQRSGSILWLNRVYTDALPPSGLIGPAPDVARLLQAFLHGGELDGARILSPQSVAMMTAAPADLAETYSVPEVSGSAHGLGWLFVADRGRVRLQHDGGGPGFATTMRLYPEEDLGIVMMANGTDLERDALAALIAQTFAGSPKEVTAQLLEH